MKKHLLLLLYTSLTLAQSNPYPQSKVDQIVQSIPIPSYGNFTIDVKKSGAKGDSIHNDKPAFDKAIAACKKHQGGTIFVPAGTYTLNGPLHLISNLRVHLDKNAKLRFSDKPELYMPLVATSWEGTMINNFSPLIYANNCKNITITGEGTIDGEGNTTWHSFKEKEKEDKLLTRQMNHKNIFFI